MLCVFIHVYACVTWGCLWNDTHHGLRFLQEGFRKQEPTGAHYKKRTVRTVMFAVGTIDEYFKAFMSLISIDMRIYSINIPKRGHMIIRHQIPTSGSIFLNHSHHVYWIFYISFQDLSLLFNLKKAPFWINVIIYTNLLLNDQNCVFPRLFFFFLIEYWKIIFKKYIAPFF